MASKCSTSSFNLSSCESVVRLLRSPETPLCELSVVREPSLWVPTLADSCSSRRLIFSSSLLVVSVCAWSLFSQASFAFTTTSTALTFSFSWFLVKVIFSWRNESSRSWIFRVNRSVSSESFLFRLSTSSRVRDKWSTSRVRFLWPAKSSSRFRVTRATSSSRSSFFLLSSLVFLASFFNTSSLSWRSSISLCSSCRFLTLSWLYFEDPTLCVSFPLEPINLKLASSSPSWFPSADRISFSLYRSFLFSASRFSRRLISFVSCTWISSSPRPVLEFTSVWVPGKVVWFSWLYIGPFLPASASCLRFVSSISDFCNLLICERYSWVISLACFSIIAFISILSRRKSSCSLWFLSLRSVMSASRYFMSLARLILLLFSSSYFWRTISISW